MKNKKRNIQTETIWGKNIEYKMPYEMAENYCQKLKNKSQWQEYLCTVVNEQFGLLGTCTKVILF